MDAVRQPIESWLGAAPEGELPVLLLVSQVAASLTQVASDLRSWLGPGANVLGTSAVMDVPEPYNGFLEAFLPSGQHLEGLLATLPPAVRDLPHAQVPRALAQSVANLARARARAFGEPLTWIVAPADGLTLGGQRLLDELHDLVREGAVAVPRIVLTLSLPESSELLLALRRRLGDSVAVIDVGEPGPASLPEGLGDLALRLLDLLAVAPCPVPEEALTVASGALEGAVEEALRQLAGAGLLAERTRPELGRGPVRAALLSSMPASRRQELHTALARGLARTGGHPGILAWHEARGTEPSRAVGPLVEAAGRCRLLGERELALSALRAAYLHLDADQWYRRIEILEQCAETLTELGQFRESLEAQEEIAELASVYGDEDRPERHGRIARSYIQIGRFEEAAKALARAEGLAGSPAAVADVRALQAELCLAQGDPAKAAERLDEAVRLLPSGPSLPLMELGYRVAYVEGRMDEALQRGRALLQAAEAAGDEHMIVMAHNALGHVYNAQSFFDEALHHYQEAVRRAEARGDRTMTSGLLVNVGVTHYDRGDLDEAKEVLTRTLRLKEREGDLRGVASALNNLGAVYEVRGERLQAQELVTKALRIMRDLKDEHSEATLCANLAGSLALLGRGAEAEATLKRTEEIATRTGSPSLRATLHQCRGEVAIQKGDWSGAERELKQARDLWGELGARIQEAGVLQGLSMAALMLSNTTAACRLAGEALAICTEVGHPGQIARSRLALALATLQRAPLRAEALAREAGTEAAPMQDPDFRALQRYVLARALMAEGRSDEAKPLLGEALQILADAAAALPEADRAAFLAHPTRALIRERAARLSS